MITCMLHYVNSSLYWPMSFIEHYVINSVLQLKMHPHVAICKIHPKVIRNYLEVKITMVHREMLLKRHFLVRVCYPSNLIYHNWIISPKPRSIAVLLQRSPYYQFFMSLNCHLTVCLRKPVLPIWFWPYEFSSFPNMSFVTDYISAC